MPKIRRKAHRREETLSKLVHPYKTTPTKNCPESVKGESITTVVKCYNPAELLSIQAGESNESLRIKKRSLKKKIKLRMKKEKWIKTLADKASKLPINEDLSKGYNNKLSCMGFANLKDALQDISDNEDSDGQDFSKINKNLKDRSVKIATQLERLKTVINHPEYAKNPFDAIRRYLSNTL